MQILTLYPDLLTFVACSQTLASESLETKLSTLCTVQNDAHASVEFATQPDMHLASLPGIALTLFLVVKSISIFNGDHLCYLVSIDSILVWLFIHAGTNLVSFPDPQNGLGTRLLLIQPHPRPASHTEARAQSRNEVRSKQKCLIASSYGVCIRQVRSVLLAPLGGVRAAAAATRAGATL